jgi:hypothetical protein
MANKTFSSGDLGMKWHKFLVFMLWIGAALNILSGIGYFTNLLYGELTTEIYAVYPTLKLFNMGTGVALIVIALFQFVARGRLKKLCSNGPKLLIASYVIVLIFNVVTSIAPAILAPAYLTVDSAYLIENIVSQIVMIAINSSYYKKREDVFVN